MKKLALEIYYLGLLEDRLEYGLEDLMSTYEIERNEAILLKANLSLIAEYGPGILGRVKGG